MTVILISASDLKPNGAKGSMTSKAVMAYCRVKDIESAVSRK